MYEAGVTDTTKFALLKGKHMSMQALGGIDHYLLARAFQKAGLDPRKAAVYSAGLTYPDIIKSFGTGQTDAAQTPVPLAFSGRGQQGRRISSAPAADIEPNCAARLLGDPAELPRQQPRRPRCGLRWHIPMPRGIFNEAAAKKDPEIMKIVSDAIKLPGALDRAGRAALDVVRP